MNRQATSLVSYPVCDWLHYSGQTGEGTKVDCHQREKLGHRDWEVQKYDLAGSEKGGLSTRVSQARVALSGMSFCTGEICTLGLSKVYWPKGT